MKNEIGKYVKGTTTIGIVCSDGIVIGADTRATAGDFIASSETKKVWKIDNNFGLAIAGLVGDAQELVRIMKAHNEIYKMNENRPMSPRSAASLLSIILQQSKMMPYYVQLIVAGIDGGESQVYSLDPLGGVMEESKFTVAGSGTEIAIGYIEDTYKKAMTTKDAIRMVVRALSLAAKRVSSTGDGMVIATITKSGYVEYNGKDLDKALVAK